MNLTQLVRELPRYREWEVGGFTRYSTLGKIRFSMDDALVVLHNSVSTRVFFWANFQHMATPQKGITVTNSLLLNNIFKRKS
jgi:hypothetical protein